MFCACIGILICFAIIIVGSVVSAIDIDIYDFGLYYVLLAIVAMCISFTVCVIRPVKCCGVRDPKWYTRACENLHQSLVAAHERRLAHLESTIGDERVSAEDSSRKKSTVTATRQRATLLMLGPAVQLMHHVIHGVAENTSAAEEDEDEEENDYPTLWWDTPCAERAEKTAGKRRRKKKKKRRKRDKEAELSTIVSSRADVVVLARPIAADSASAINYGHSADTDISKSHSPTRAKSDGNIEEAKETFL